MALPVKLDSTLCAEAEYADPDKETLEDVKQYVQERRKDLLERRLSKVVGIIDRVDRVRQCIFIELFSAGTSATGVVRGSQTTWAGGPYQDEEGDNEKRPFLFAGRISVSKDCIPKRSCTVRRDSDTCEATFGYDGPGHRGFPEKLAGRTREALLREILEGNPDVQADNLETALEEAIGRAVWTQLGIKPEDIIY